MHGLRSSDKVLARPRFSDQFPGRLPSLLVSEPPTANFAAIPGEVSLRHLQKGAVLGADDFHFGS